MLSLRGACMLAADGVGYLHTETASYIARCETESWHRHTLSHKTCHIYIATTLSQCTHTVSHLMSKQQHVTVRQRAERKCKWQHSLYTDTVYNKINVIKSQSPNRTTAKRICMSLNSVPNFQNCTLVSGCQVPSCHQT